ncbi:MAG: B12-binding domain-containing radical SAM protein [Planctomycetota bacterium]|nr:MAG: B12-binding domain-containing radical SAM protein [Planctomycetota bacterium]
MSMHFLFVHIAPHPWMKTYTGYLEGIGILAATLRRRGHEPSLLVLHEFDREKIKKAMKKHKPDMAGLSITSSQMPLARKTSDALANGHGLPLVAGGAHPTLMPEEVLELPGMVGVFRGECDHVFADWVDEFSAGKTARGVQNFSYLEAGSVVNNPVGFPEDLSALPIPDRAIFPMREMISFNADLVGAEFVASRGCPYSCAYCNNPIFNELRGGVHHRRKSVERMLEEIEAVLSEYPEARCLGFNDDIFTCDRDWVMQFCGEYPGRVDRPWWSNTQVAHLDDELVGAMAEAGCTRLHMGVETGSEKLRRDELNKQISNKQIEEAFEMVHSHNMKPVAFMMLGIPGETEETLRESVEFLRKLRPFWTVVSLFSPFPGTALGDRARAEGLCDDDLPEDYYHLRPLKLRGVEEEALLWYYNNFNDLVRHRRGILP